MDVRAELVAACPPQRLFAIVEDLGSYPSWLSIVARADVAEPAESPGPSAAEARPGWHVELRGRLGPFARSKRLRMARTIHETPRRVRFERDERDGRAHAPWVLEGRVEATTHGSVLVMELHYGGAFGGSALRRMLDEEIEASRPRLAALAADSGSTNHLPEG